jgi:hypothetical protein
LTAEPIPSAEDGEELPGSPPSPVPGGGNSGNEGTRTGTGWPETGGSQSGTAGPQDPGPGLAAGLRTAAGEAGAGLRKLTDEELIEVISGGRRLSSWATWTELAAMAEYGNRHPHQAGDPGPFGGGAADEVGFATRMSWTSAGNRMMLGADLATRCPRTFAALRQGLIDMVHAMIIHDATKYLSVADALAADAELAVAAQGMTPGQLRYLAMKVILKLDPDALAHRKEAAKRDAQVRVFREYSGNAGISGRELPADEVLASWQNVEDWALWLRERGARAGLRDLQVQVVMDLLQGRDPAASLTTTLAGPGGADQEERPGIPADDEAPYDEAPYGEAPYADPFYAEPFYGEPPCEDALDDDGPDDDGPEDDGQEDDGPDDDGPDDDGPEDEGPGDGGGEGPRGPGGSGAGRPGRDGGARLAAQVTIIVPFEAWMGWPTSQAGEVPGWGPVDTDTLNALLAAATRDPGSRLCLTLLGPDRTAVAHGCAPGRFALPFGGTDQDIPGDPDPPGTAGPRRQPPPPARQAPVQDMIGRLQIPLAPIARGTCGHEHAEDQYRPSRKLAHLVQARSPRCTAAGCTNPAVHCDLDHTRPWDKGGLTCECGLAPLCRHHHRVKQLEHWHLEQPQPGVLIWHTPAGRTYITKPAQY